VELEEGKPVAEEWRRGGGRKREREKGGRGRKKINQAHTISSPDKEASRGIFLASRTTNAKYGWLPATHGEQVCSKDAPSAGWAPFLPAI